MKSILSFKLALPVAVLLSGGLAQASLNIFNYNNIVVDPTYTSAVIAPFTAPCALYGLSCTGTKTFPDGFPLKNLFGGHEATAEKNTYDTIFNDGGSSPYGYDNVFFHTANAVNVSNAHLVVTGSQDGPSQARQFTYFDLISYTFNPAAPLDPSYYKYKVLYHGTPTTDANGFEKIDTHVDLTNAGSYFVYQFGTNTSFPNDGARVFGVSAFDSTTFNATPEPGFYGLMTIGLAGMAVFARRQAEIPKSRCTPGSYLSAAPRKQKVKARLDCRPRRPPRHPHHRLALPE